MLLELSELIVAIDSPEGRAIPVNHVSLSLAPGTTLALVGESGCGKTLTCLAVIGLLPSVARIVHGKIKLGGVDITGDSDAARSVRRRNVAMIFQNPAAALNPVRTIGWQVAEAFRLREGLDRKTANRRAIELLDLVGIPEPARRARNYPHSLSGGMNQRAMIAMAIAGNPKLLIADEATTALDVTIQAQILELLARLQKEFGMAIVFVTHDLATVAEISNDVAVMYAGQVIETTDVQTLFRQPHHPYTQGLLTSLPRADKRAERLFPIEGTVPALHELPTGCPFAPRCGSAYSKCHETRPPLEPIAGKTLAACHSPLPSSETPRTARPVPVPAMAS